MSSPVPFLYPSRPDEVLWRYMDVFRLVDLLRTSELHMTRADNMDDQWEGSGGTIFTDRDGNRLSDDSRYLRLFAPGLYKFARRLVYMNCWYMGQGESYAMWKLYGAAGKGVAVKTTVGQLEEAVRPFTQGSYVTGSAVHYVNYDETEIPKGNELSRFIHKRECYAYEQEYRLLEVEDLTTLWKEDRGPDRLAEPNNAPFLRRPVDLEVLINEIYISPDTEGWIATTLESLVSDYAPWAQIVYSDLGQAPRY